MAETTHGKAQTRFHRAEWKFQRSGDVTMCPAFKERKLQDPDLLLGNLPERGMDSIHPFGSPEGASGRLRFFIWDRFVNCRQLTALDAAQTIDPQVTRDGINPRG